MTPPVRGPGPRLMSLLLVLAGAAVGAPLRFLTDRAVQARHDTVLPWGTFTVNVVGSLVLGVLAGRGEHRRRVVRVCSWRSAAGSAAR